MNALLLIAAIASEIIGTTSLKLTEGFTRPLPTLLTVVAYAAAFYFLSLLLRTMPIGIVYAIWSGAGIALLALIDVFWFHSRIDAAGFVGLALILAGVLVINLLSTTTGH